MSNRRLPSRRRFLKYSALGVAGFAGLGGNLTGLFQSGVVSAASNPITVENAQPGSSNWFLTKPGDDTNLQVKGYASATSLNRGDSIDFHVSVSPAQSYTMEIYRIGWYNGTGGRLMTTVGPLAGATYAVPAPDALGTVDCKWPVTSTFQVPATWTTGVYLVKLVNSQGWQNHIHFVVRDDASTADVMFQCSVTTYQAYNTFGGKSLYPEDSVGGVAARKVSFDRPYQEFGSGHFYDWEMPTVRFVEKYGYNVAYCTNIDLHTTANLVDNHKAFLSVGHDEYWSEAMYNHALAFRTNRKHLAFLGANEIYWQMRMESAANGTPNRLITCYKNYYAEDPVYIADHNSPNTTYLWRELPPGNASPAISRPENQLVGVMYDGYKDNARGQAYIVQNSSHWVYAGTGFVNGTSVKGIVGYEWDKRFNNGLEPAGLVTLAASPVNVQGGGKSTSNATIYQASSGAWVFSVGSIYWSYALDYIDGYQVADVRNAGIQRVTRNVLDRFVGSTTIVPPAITTLSPGSANQNGVAFVLTVNGSNFVSGATVKWNGSARTTNFVNNGQLTAQITAADLTTAGSFAVTVTNPDSGLSNSVNFVVVAPAQPKITSLSPTTATQNGAAFVLTVNGSNFVSGATVKWNGSARTTAFVSASQLTAQITAADLTTAGTFAVTVTNPDNSQSNSVNFTVNPASTPGAPTLTSLLPTTVERDWSDFNLTIKGTNFVKGAVVKWDGQARPTTFVSSTQIKALIENAQTLVVGYFPVTVTNPDGKQSNAINFYVHPE